ncbi:MAG TPA: DUF3221 domain-containing protein, partial [Gemmatimonadales bacterium]|nr:DUF3221 domain-containing protein [Gemmatimonadales bacterium]
GTITHKSDDRLLIEEEPLDSVGSAKASLRITSSTRVLQSSGEASRPEELRIGQRVSAWFAGPVMESYPVQGTAGAVRIEGETMAGDELKVDGIIRYHELEGGFYAIQSKEGETYNPINLPEAFRQDGLPVSVRLRLRDDLLGIHQAGPIVEIIEIRRR